MTALSLRLLEILVPDAAQAEIDRLLETLDAVDCWQEPIMDERRLVRVLVPAGQAEAVLDEMESRFAAYPAFRAVILNVVATIPRIEEPEPEPEPTSPALVEEPKKKKRSRVARDELLAAIEGGTRVTPVFLATVCLSAVVAGVGLYRDSVAVLVGAMVIAPLLTPNIALALATTLGDLDLGRRAVRTNLVGLGLALGLALLAGVFVPADAVLADEFLARTKPEITDTVLALASGAAGALAFTTGLSAGLVGVMVAVALLPPLLVTGVSLGAGRPNEALGAGLLLATNIICVNLAAVLTFLVQGVVPRTWWESDKAKRATRRAVWIWGGLTLCLVALLLLQTRRG